MWHACIAPAASQTSLDTGTSAGEETAEEKPAKKSKKGKKVQWPADDADLATFHFFEMDEDERGMLLILEWTFWFVLKKDQFNL